MKKHQIITLIALLSVILAACGVKNSTPMDAAETFMTSLVNGDVEANAEINASDMWSFPADHMISLANEWGIVGADVDDFTFEQDSEDSNLVHVLWEIDGKEKDITLKFIETSDGYLFEELD